MRRGLTGGGSALEGSLSKGPPRARNPPRVSSRAPLCDRDQVTDAHATCFRKALTTSFGTRIIRVSYHRARTRYMVVDGETLRAWRNQLLREIEELRARIAPLQEEFTRKHDELAALDSLLALQGPSLTSAPAPSQATATPPRRKPAFVDTACDALRTLGRPTHYRELHARLADQGVRIPGRNPLANLLAHMTRDHRFTRVARGTYGLAEWGPARLRRTRKRRARRSRR